MESKTRAVKASLDELTETLNNAISNDLKEAERGQPYWQAKRQLNTLLDLHKLLQAKITNEKVDLTLPKTQMVTVVDEAHPGKSPDKPNKTLYITLGVVIGLLVG